MEFLEDLREQSFRSTFNQDWHEVVPLAILQLGIDGDGRNVREPVIDLIAANNIPVACVRDEGTMDEEIAPVHTGRGVIEEPTLAGATSRGLRWVGITIWKSTSHIDRVRSELNLSEGLRRGRESLQGEARRQQDNEGVHGE